jgi:glutaredoxin-related protein
MRRGLHQVCGPVGYLPFLSLRSPLQRRGLPIPFNFLSLRPATSALVARTIHDPPHPTGHDDILLSEPLQSSEPTHPTGHEGILPSEPQQQLHTESLRELLERIEREDQEKIGAAERAFESGEEIQEHIHSVLRLKKYRCVVFMYGDEKNPEDGDGYAVIKMLQRCSALFKTFDLNKYPRLLEGLVNYTGSGVRGNIDIPQVYIVGEPFGSLDKVMDASLRGHLTYKLQVGKAQAHFYQLN